MENEYKEFYSVKEFAKKIGKQPITIRRAIKSKRINAIRIGNGKRASYSIPAIEIERIAILNLEDIINKLVEERLKYRLNEQGI